MIQSAHYALVVRGRLDAQRSAWFPGLTLSPGEEGTTLLTGPIADQAALHGVLNRLRDLGLEIIELRRELPPDGE